jgi:hypothetical protein
LISAQRIFSDDVLKEHFDHSADPHRWLTRIGRSIDMVNEFGQQHRWEDLSGLTRQEKPASLAERLQYFKDETLLTLYGLVALDELIRQRKPFVERTRKSYREFWAANVANELKGENT